MTTSILIGIVGGVAVFNSIFLGLLLLTKSPVLLKNRLLGFLFLSLSVRIGKSLLIVLFPNVPDSVPAIGLIGMTATGPLLFLYIQNLLNGGNQLGKSNYLHFLWLVPVAVLLMLNSEKVVLYLYIASSVQLSVYLLLAVKELLSKEQPLLKSWLSVLVGSMVVLCLIYASQIVIETDIAYLTVTLIATIVLYVLLFFVFRNEKPFATIRTALEPTDKARQLANQLVELMEKKNLFTESDLTVARVAKVLGVKPYQISQALSQCLKKSFPDFVNRYRVEEVRHRLLSSKYEHYSIEAIAFDCGFSTPSAFYISFKKITGQTPTEFKNANLVYP